MGQRNFVQHLLRLYVTIFLLKGSKKDFHFYPPALGRMNIYLAFHEEDKFSPMAIRDTLMKNAAFHQAVITLLCTNKCVVTHFYVRINVKQHTFMDEYNLLRMINLFSISINLLLIKRHAFCFLL